MPVLTRRNLSFLIVAGVIESIIAFFLAVAGLGILAFYLVALLSAPIDLAIIWKRQGRP